MHNVTTPAGTLSTAPQVSTFVQPIVILQQIELVVPPGHLGLTGWALRLNGSHMVPFGDFTTFIVADDERIVLPFDYEMPGNWQVATYNTDVNAHTHYVRYLVADLPAVPVQPRTLIVL